MKIIILLLTLLFISCAEEKTEQRITLDEKRFVQVYCDVVSKTDFLKDEQKEAFVESVLTYYSTSREIFENTVKKYSEKPEKWKRLFEKIGAELEKRLEQVEKTDKPDTTKTKKNQKS